MDKTMSTKINTINDVFKDALAVKETMDEQILLGDSLYLCRACGAVTDYWKLGEICQACETIAERQEDMAQGN